MIAAIKMAKIGAAIIECVIPLWCLRKKSGPKKETTTSMSGNIAPIRKAIATIFSFLCENPALEPRIPISP